MSAQTFFQSRSGRTNQGGMGLIELMIAILLGILVAGSAVAIFSTNRSAWAATESLGRIQENSRLAYEMMARDLRDAGGTPCARNTPMANVTSGANWWRNWGNGSVIGFNQGAAPPAGAPANMTTLGDSFVALSANGLPLSVVSHDNAGGNFKLNMPPTGVNPLDLVVVCDYRQGSLFQIAAGGVSTATNTISYSQSGMNCTKDLTMPVKCGSAKNGVKYGNNAMIGRLRSVAWYVAANTHGGTSLFQSQLASNGTMSNQEIAEGVTGMQVTYLLNTGTGYVDAAGVAGNWANVMSVRITLTMQGGQGQERASVTGGALTRTLTQTISLRDHQS
ncbi:MAG: PilW family protein [Proteobacteria bacterium]|nr:PilW family protein [Pseudomonadota bacterium]